jgi:RNA polymerase sigma-70 factor (ECF subfamily)
LSSSSRPTQPPDSSVTRNASLGPGPGAPPGGGTPIPPRAVLEGVCARSPEALAIFFEHYFDLVFGLTLRLLGHRAQAEDVTQEVFYKVHRAAHRLDPARDPAPWLTAIAYNACRDLWRSGAYRLDRRSGSLDDPEVAPRLTGGTNDPERDLIARERERLVQDAIGSLSEEARAIVLMHDYQGLNHMEIAEILGIEHAAARKRYSRALATLGRLLKEKLG